MVLPLDHPSPQCLSHFSIQPPRASPTLRSFGEETQHPGRSLPEGPPENQEGIEEEEKRLVQSLTQQGNQRVDQTPEAQPTPVATLKASPSWNVARTHVLGPGGLCRDPSIPRARDPGPSFLYKPGLSSTPQASLNQRPCPGHLHATPHTLPSFSRELKAASSGP